MLRTSPKTSAESSGDENISFARRLFKEECRLLAILPWQRRHSKPLP
jgi:hypothetical protein